MFSGAVVLILIIPMSSDSKILLGPNGEVSEVDGAAAMAVAVKGRRGATDQTRCAVVAIRKRSGESHSIKRSGFSADVYLQYV